MQKITTNHLKNNEMKTFKIVKSHHLTALEKKLISTSIDNNLQDVQTKRKRLNINSFNCWKLLKTVILQHNLKK